MYHVITLSLCALLLISAGIGAAVQAVRVSIRYRCDTGIVLDAAYGKPVNGRATVRITVAGKSYLLMQERAASGARYSADGRTWWSKSDQAIFLLPGQQAPAANCQQLAD